MFISCTTSSRQAIFRILRSASIVFLGLSLTHCGLGLGGGTGSGAASNEPAPTGTLLAQGNLTAENSATVSGSASVYVSGTAYTVRLSGLAAPSENGLQLRVYQMNSGNTPACSTSLVYRSGSKNYPCSAGNGVFTSVAIYSVQTQVNYGVALLQQVNR